MQPTIIFSSSPDGGENYARAIAAAGGRPVGGYCPPLDESCRGLVLCGGGDVHPSRFGQPDQGSFDIDLARDRAEFALVRHFLERGKPILGICRGHQVLNIALGGTLCQDLGPDLRAVHTRGKDPVDRLHPVSCAPGSFFARLFGTEHFVVNSSHHQAVDRPGDGLELCLFSPDGVAEGMVHTSLPVFSVQFHPERMPSPQCPAGAAAGAPVLEYFLSLCQEGSHGR